MGERFTEAISVVGLKEVVLWFLKIEYKLQAENNFHALYRLFRDEEQGLSALAQAIKHIKGEDWDRERLIEFGKELWEYASTKGSKGMDDVFLGLEQMPFIFQRDRFLFIYNLNLKKYEKFKNKAKEILKEKGMAYICDGNYKWHIIDNKTDIDELQKQINRKGVIFYPIEWIDEESFDKVLDRIQKENIEHIESIIDRKEGIKISRYSFPDIMVDINPSDLPYFVHIRLSFDFLIKLFEDNREILIDYLKHLINNLSLLKREETIIPEGVSNTTISFREKGKIFVRPQEEGMLAIKNYAEENKLHPQDYLLFHKQRQVVSSMIGISL